MKASYSWLSEYSEHKLSPRDLARRLTVSGLEVEGLVSQDGDWIMDVKVPPNRPDCLSHIGLAREMGNILKKMVKLPSFRVNDGGGSVSDYISVVVREKRLCPLYAGRVVVDVSIRPSPEWLKKRIESVGIRSINNVVDVTNYVLMEYGHPLHAFDLDLLEGKRIVVRRGKPGETLTTLDGNLRVADENTLLICDEKKPVALAGVMGGSNSEIRAETRQIFLESAYFDPLSIRRTARRLFLATESSYRFERGVDHEGLVPALNRAAYLISEVAGGKVAHGVVKAFFGRPRTPAIPLSLDYTNRLLGTSLNKSEVERCISLPGYKVKSSSKKGSGTAGTGWVVSPPSWRVDLSCQEDLIEEVARLTGYDSIPADMPEVPMSVKESQKSRDFAGEVRALLSHCGCHEVITYSFISSKSLDMLRVAEGDKLRKVLPLRNPLTEEQAVMRTSLIPGLLQAMTVNVRLRNMGVKIFEIGRVFISSGSERLPVEKTMLGILMSGPRHAEGWNVPHDDVDYFDIKGVVEDLLEGVGLLSAQFRHSADIPYLHNGTSTRILLDGEEIGVMGMVHDSVMDSLDIKGHSYICEIDCDALSRVPRREVSYTPISKYPGTVRDLAIIVDESIPAQRAIDSFASIPHELIKDVSLFDLYRGGNIPPGKKSFAFRITFSVRDRTVTDSEVDKIFEEIMSHLEKDLGAIIRRKEAS